MTSIAPGIKAIHKAGYTLCAPIMLCGSCAIRGQTKAARRKRW